MIRTLLVLEDGTELHSGAGTKNAIQSVAITERVNSEQEITLGSTCANILEARIIAPAGELSIKAGEEITVYKIDDNMQRYQIGVFIAEKPTRPTANSMSITAYDRVVKLDQDLTQWLAELTQWPCPLLVLAELVCEKCGLSLKNEEIPNGEYPVQKFSGEGITGRQIMQWIGQVAGRFCRATADGEIEFAWYEPLTTHNIGVSSSGGGISYANGNLTIACEGIAAESDDAGDLGISSEQMTVTDDGNGNVVLVIPESVQTVMYYQNGLSFEDYTVAAIEKVQLRQNEEDVGTVYPDGLEGERNTYIITGNPLVTALSADDLVPVAQTLYEILKDVSYTPCKVSVPANMVIRAGHTVQITDRNGKTITAYVMTKTQKGQKDTLECTGSPKRDSTTVVNNRSYADLQGKVLNLRMDVEGLKVANTNNAEKTAELELNLNGIRGQVSSQEENVKKISTLEQAANEVKLSVEKIQTDGATKLKTGMKYTFDDAGINIHKDGSEITNRLKETGMYVISYEGTDRETTMLQADADGVVATDVKVRNYLVIGTHARFEDYGEGRTACFYLGGS